MEKRHCHQDTRTGSWGNHCRFPWRSSERDSRNQQNRSGCRVTVPGAARQSQPSPGAAAPESGCPQGRDLPPPWLATVHEAAQLRTPGCASSNTGILLHGHNPSQRHQKGKQTLSCFWRHENFFLFILQDFLEAIPHLWKVSPAVQQLAVPAGISQNSAGPGAERCHCQGPCTGIAQKINFSGTCCGNPDKTEELSWQGMVFSHTLPEGLHFLSHPTLPEKSLNFCNMCTQNDR